MVGIDVVAQHRRHRPVLVLRYRWQRLFAQQRPAGRHAAVRRASRHLDAALRYCHQPACRPAQGVAQRRRGPGQQADLDRRPAPVSTRGLVLPLVRRGRHRAAAFAGGVAQPQRVGAVCTCTEQPHPDPTRPAGRARTPDQQCRPRGSGGYVRWAVVGGVSRQPSVSRRSLQHRTRNGFCCRCSGAMAGPRSCRPVSRFLTSPGRPLV